MVNKSNGELGKTGFFMAKLLSGKKPLLNKKMGKESVVSTAGLSASLQSSCSSSTINQSMLRARFNRSIYPGSSVVQSSFVYPCTNVLNNSPKCKDSADNNLKMETNNDKKIEAVDGKPTYQVVAIQPVSSDHYFSFNPYITNRYLTKRPSSSSSTSTELCDEIIGINNNYDDDDNDSVYTLEKSMPFSTKSNTDQLDGNENSFKSKRRNSKSLDNIYNIVAIPQQTMEYENDNINSISKNEFNDSVLGQTIIKFQEQINQIKID